MSRFHFHRLFKSVTGLTPKAYALAWRAQRLRTLLPASASVTAAAYNAGYNSSAGFYAGSTQALGMKPSSYRAGGAGESIRYAVGKCALGKVLVAATDRGLCAILLGDDADALVRDIHRRFAAAKLGGGNRKFAQWVTDVIAMMDTPAAGLNLPLDLRGTAFQQRVWQALREIPPGNTASYAQIAQRIGAPGAARAVGQAIAANPLAVAIPCHRVIRSNGALSGYRWGIERKQALLERESVKR